MDMLSPARGDTHASVFARIGGQLRAIVVVFPAVFIPFTVVLLPLSPRGSSSASAAVVPAQVSAATSQSPASSGTAEWTMSGADEQLVPPKASRDLGAMHITSTWAIADTTHYRIEAKTSSPPHARLLGQQSYLGRTADVVEVHPVWKTTGTSCSTDAHGKQQCKTVTHGYGRQQIWVDSEHLLILKVQVTGLPRAQGGNYTYQVTSITFGQQPKAAQLAFTSPVPVTDPPDSQSTASTGSGSSGTSVGGTTGWQAPPGFLSVGAPVGPKGRRYASTGSGQAGEPGGQGIAGVSVIFAARSSHLHATKANFVLVQERKRENGPPPLFATGAIQPAGTCQAVTGTFPDGIHWLGFARNDIYAMVSSDNFTEGDLVRYAATAICR